MQISASCQKPISGKSRRTQTGGLEAERTHLSRSCNTLFSFRAYRHPTQTILIFKVHASMATPVINPPGSLLEEKLKKSSPGKIGVIVFAVMLVGGLIYIGMKLSSDLSVVHSASVFPFILLG